MEGRAPPRSAVVVKTEQGDGWGMKQRPGKKGTDAALAGEQENGGKVKTIGGNASQSVKESFCAIL